jgi:hypothetical protein
MIAILIIVIILLFWQTYKWGKAWFYYIRL